MTDKKGKYDEHCEAALRRTNADAVLLIIIGGSQGHGFSVAVKNDLKDAIVHTIPKLLHSTADEIEKMMNHEDLRNSH